jgi:DNA-binding IclR family transcriptional regulator
MLAAIGPPSPQGRSALSSKGDKRRMVKSAIRVLDILEHVSRTEDGCTHAEIARALSIPPSSLTALLRDLTQSNYATLDEATGRYTVGPQVLHLSSGYMRNLSIVRLGQPVLLELFRELNEYTSLSVPRDTEVTKVFEYAINDPRAYAIQIGESGPMHALAAGKAILAHYPVALQKRLVERLRRGGYVLAFRHAATDSSMAEESCAPTGLKYLKAITLTGALLLT